MSDDVQGTSKGFLSSAVLVGAVAVILLAGFLLKSASTERTPRPQAGVVAAAPALGSSISPELAPPPTAEPASEPAATPAPERTQPPVESALAARAEADAARLARSRSRFTAQLVVACRTETVDRLLAAGAGSTKLYVIPARVRDDACFRVCFGTYASAKDAVAASDMPAGLRGREKIVAAEIAKVIP